MNVVVNHQSNNPEVLDLAISGMHCAGCVTRVETALLAVDGVERCSVNLATEQARVFGDHIPDQTRQLIDAIDGLGFSAEVLNTAEPVDDGARKSHHDLMLSAFGAVLTLPMIVQMVSMLLDGEAFLSPWVQFALTVPVQFIVGWRFYRPAWWP